jgi:hypothetical protein
VILARPPSFKSTVFEVLLVARVRAEELSYHDADQLTSAVLTLRGVSIPLAPPNVRLQDLVLVAVVFRVVAIRHRAARVWDAHALAVSQGKREPAPGSRSV